MDVTRVEATQGHRRTRATLPQQIERVHLLAGICQQEALQGQTARRQATVSTSVILQMRKCWPKLADLSLKFSQPFKQQIGFEGASGSSKHGRQEAKHLEGWLKSCGPPLRQSGDSD